MSLRVKSAPREEHLNRTKHIYGYLTHFCESDVKELVPLNIPEPLGNYITMTTYAAANLYHDMITDRFPTGIMHFLNQMLIDW